MAEYILKDSRGKEQTFADDKIFVQSTDGELVQFTMGTGGSASADLHYVTFMSYDGLTEYGKKAVADGDDCADPIARGIFDTPIRESDAQYNYTHSGWATEANGAADADWNKAVTEDKTVYAVFTGAVRYYTITFYDEDGTTVLNTISVAYGSVPSYTPTKDDYDFAGWNPIPVAVTGDASYTATWKEKVAFATATWAQIAETCAAGNHASSFAIGDSRPVTLTYDDGTSETINFTIIDMDVDQKASDGSTAALTLMADNIVKTSLQPASAYNKGKGDFWEMDNAMTFFDDIFAALPSDLQEVITPVYKRKLYSKSNLTNVFIASERNLFGTEKVASNNNGSEAEISNMSLIPYKQYKAFANGATKKRTKISDTTKDDYWTSSLYSVSVSSYQTVSFRYVDGSSMYSSSADPTSSSHGIVPCFCIG